MGDASVQVQRPYGALVRGSLWATPAILAASALLQVVGVDPVLVWILGGILAGVSLMLGVILYFMSGRMYKELQWLVSGNAWVQWQYDRDEWEQFMDNEWKRTRRTIMWLFLLVPVFGLMFMGMGTAWLVGAVIVSGLLWGVLYFGLQQHYGRQKAISGVALIGPNGCYLGTTYTSWSGMSGSLQSVQLKEGNPYRVEFEVMATTVGEHPTSTTNTLRVAVPRGREAEAQSLVQRFYSRPQQ